MDHQLKTVTNTHYTALHQRPHVTLTSRTLTTSFVKKEWRINSRGVNGWPSLPTRKASRQMFTISPTYWAEGRSFWQKNMTAGTASYHCTSTRRSETTSEMLPTFEAANNWKRKKSEYKCWGLKRPQIIESKAFLRIGYALITANTQVKIHFEQERNFN